MAAAVDMAPIVPSATADAALLSEIAQYEKIVALRDDILAGRHPRVKLPAPSSSSTTTVDVSQSAQSTTTAVHQQATSSAIGLTNGHATEPHPVPEPAHPPTSASQPAINGASTPSEAPKGFFSRATHKSPKFDPLLLQKSNELVMAELKLERQRIERGFEAQLQQRRSQSKRFNEHDTMPDFDISEALATAQEQVKHLPPGAAPAAANTNGRVRSPSESGEEATYYSSQVNEASTDDSGDRAKLRATKPCRYFFEGACRRGDACSYSHDPAFRHQLQGLGRPGGVANGEHDRHAGRGPRGGRLRGSPTYSNRESGEIDDSPYSPALQVPVEDSRPPPDAPREPRGHDRYNNNNNNNHNRHEQEQAPFQNNRRGGRRQPSPGGNRRSGRFSPDGRDGRVVRNHITSPVAPQPSRVSPLAVAKNPRLERLALDEPPEERSPRQSGRAPSHNQSPASQPSARKRRRDIEDYGRNVAPRRLVVAESPPPPEIKAEPLSPPPLLREVPVQQQRYVPHPDEVVRVPVEYRAPSRQADRVVYQPLHPDERAYAQQQPEIRRMTPVPPPQPVRRVFSGPEVLQYEPANGSGGRRIVSARYPERAASPSVREYQGPPSAGFPPPHVREGSPAYVLPPAQTNNYRGSVPPQPPRQAVYQLPPEPAASPEPRRPGPAPYSPVERRGTALSMAPPRRFILDQDGNRYYEAPRPEPRPEVRPELRALPQHEPRDPYYQDGPLISPRDAQPPIQRIASVRPPTSSRVVSDGGGGRYLPANGPAPEVRYVEYRPSAAAGPPSASYHPQQAPTQQRYYDAPPPPPERAYRDRAGDVVHVVREYPPPPATERREVRYVDAPPSGPLPAARPAQPEIIRVGSVAPSARAPEPYDAGRAPPGGGVRMPSVQPGRAEPPQQPPHHYRPPLPQQMEYEPAPPRRPVYHAQSVQPEVAPPAHRVVELGRQSVAPYAPREVQREMSARPGTGRGYVPTAQPPPSLRGGAEYVPRDSGRYRYVEGRDGGMGYVRDDEA